MVDETRPEIPSPEPLAAPVKRVIFGRADGVVVIEPGEAPVVVAQEKDLK